MKAFTILVLVAPLALAACSSNSTILRDGQGHIVSCNATGGGIVGATVASMAYSKCMKAYQDAGFKPVSGDGVAP